MNYTNLVEIYKNLSKVALELDLNESPEAKGFNNCLYLLKKNLNSFEDINLHIENEKLNRELFLTKDALENTVKNNKELKEQNNELNNKINKIVKLESSNKNLIKENEVLRNQVENNNFNLIKGKMVLPDMKKVEIETDQGNINFYINTSKELFMTYFEGANRFISIRKKKRVHLSTIKCWYLDYYREKGFTCVV